MTANYLSAAKPMCIVYCIPHWAFEHPQVKYFLRPLKIMDIPTLTRIIHTRAGMPNSIMFKAIFLVAFFGFFPLSNLASHIQLKISVLSNTSVLKKKSSEVKLLLKWSKTNQINDQVRVITLHRLKSDICPYYVLTAILKWYNPGRMQPLFKCCTHTGWQVLTDTRVRKNSGFC